MRVLMAALALLLAAGHSKAAENAVAFSTNFIVHDIELPEVMIHLRVGGAGEAVVLLHGFGETGDMWAPLASELAKSHTVVVPDLRGMGLSSRPEGGYEKKAQARDIARVLDVLGLKKIALVTHDIGNMVGYAFAAQFPNRVSRFVIIDAPLPGIGPWDEIARRHTVWHWSFWGADAERLVAGRERIYLDRFWNEFVGPGNRYPEALREHHAALYARPGAMHAAFEQFKAFDQDVIDNQAFAAQGKLNMPVLAVGGERSYGALMTKIMQNVASDVTGRVIAGSGHWVLEERPVELTEAVHDFLDARASSR
jgi:pimeloyl-ACP methyl ester carboxylesterase